MSDIVIPSIENIDLLRTLKDVKELTIKIHETLVTTKKALDKKIKELISVHRQKK